MQRADTVVVTNIGGESVDDFVALAEALGEHAAIDAFEVNLSCPNVQEGKLPFATDPRMASRVIEGVRRATKKPIFAKLSPNVSRIGEMAVAVEAAGADAITAVNTVLGMKVDWRTRKPGLFTVQGVDLTESKSKGFPNLDAVLLLNAHVYDGPIVPPTPVTPPTTSGGETESTATAAGATP